MLGRPEPLRTNMTPRHILKKIEAVKIAPVKRLDLSYQKLSQVPSEVFELSDLISLHLKGNELCEIPEEIRRLSNLKWLDVRFNPLERIPDIPGLALEYDQYQTLTTPITPDHIVGIHLNPHRAKEVPPELLGWKNLRVLDLSNCHLTSVPEWVSQLIGLTDLYLGDNQLTSLPEWLSQFTKLKILAFSSNQLAILPEWLQQLSSLSRLYCYGNLIGTLPEWLTQFKNLTILDLGHNKLSSLPESIGKLTSLIVLDLACNQISRIPETIRQLVNLHVLNLDGNALTEIPEVIYELRSLEKLSFINEPWEESENQITSISPKILQLKKLEKFYVEGNPITSPPPEIVEQGVEAIRNFFGQAQQQGTTPLYSAKVLIVGEPGAGKTTLLRKLIDPTYPVPNTNEESTVGIEVHSGWEFLLAGKPEIIFSANLWDFGGQQIQYLTHHFFLTSRALYVLVADDREQRTDFDYWFRIIELLGHSSPVLVVLNEKNHRSISNFDVQKYRQRYQFFNDTRDVDFANNDGRVDALRRRIQEMLASLPHVGTPLPKQWIPIRQTLEAHKDQNHLGISDYFAICCEHGISNETDQLQLSGYLHDLGIILHFQHDPGLADMVIVNPVWATKGVYQLLSDTTVVRQHGRFSRKWLDQVWEAQGYNFLERGKLLALMLKDNFELCFKLSDNDGGEYLTPQLLPTIHPDFPWDARDNLRFRFQYPFLPKGLISRLIVRLGDYIDRTTGADLIWAHGAVFSRDGVRARVVEDETRREGLKVIDIAVSGGDVRQRREFLAQIRGELGIIHQRSFASIRYDEMIPCNCPDCRDHPEPTFFEHKTLLKYERARRQTIVCEKELRDVSVKALLDGVIATGPEGPIPVDLQQRIVKALISLPNLHDTESHRAFILSAGIDAQLISQIQLDRPTAQFVQILVSTLLTYGRLEDERHPLIAILEAAQQHVGRDRQAECQALIEALEGWNYRKNDKQEGETPYQAMKAGYAQSVA